LEDPGDSDEEDDDDYVGGQSSDDSGGSGSDDSDSDDSGSDSGDEPKAKAKGTTSKRSPKEQTKVPTKKAKRKRDANAPKKNKNGFMFYMESVKSRSFLSLPVTLRQLELSITMTALYVHLRQTRPALKQSNPDADLGSIQKLGVVRMNESLPLFIVVSCL
jgi:hypothetical protein